MTKQTPNRDESKMAEFKMSSLSAAYKDAFAFKNWFNWSGKASFDEYWYVGPLAVLLVVLDTFYSPITNLIFGPRETKGLILGAVTLVLAFPLLALGARRSNDTGNSATIMSALLMIPVVGGLIYFIILAQKTKVAMSAPKLNPEMVTDTKTTQTLYDAEGNPVTTRKVFLDAKGQQYYVEDKPATTHTSNKSPMSPIAIIAIVIGSLILLASLIPMLFLGLLFSGGHL